VGIVLQVREQSARIVVGRGRWNTRWDAGADRLADGVAAGGLCLTGEDVEDAVVEEGPVGSDVGDAAR
jgi:hypothetical protein